MFVIGTAGHIDHGKSAIIKRLTGIDPDRLPEEKSRGMTIDIGFAHFDTPGGERIGIIDVPGHERFVRNMIAGAGGIDAVILVVAADDGWMPQSQEHLQITKLLGIRYGIVVISKIDLVEKSWVDLVEDDVKDRLKHSFLENAPVVRLSSVTGDGFDILRDEIQKLAEMITVREDIRKPRLYIDRSFVLPGMGGVVAGSLRGGKLKTGQNVSVFPSRRRGKVRTIQSHGRQIEFAEPGQRTSISLTGIDKEHLLRGGVITTPELVENYPDRAVLALAVRVLPESSISLKDRRKLLIILGTTELEGEIRLYGNETIAPGGKGIVFFRPVEQVLSFVGDRFIFRLPTPQVTIGGGSVLDIIDRSPRKKEMSRYMYLEDREELTPEKLVATELTKAVFVSREKSFLWCNYSQAVIDRVFKGLEKQSILDEYRGRYYRSSDLAPSIDAILSAMKSYFETHPHFDGTSVDVIAAQVEQRVQSIGPILELMCGKKLLMKKKNRFDLPGRSVKVKGTVKEAAALIEKELVQGGFSPPSVKELLHDDRLRAEAFDYLVVVGKVVRLGSGLAFHAEKWNEVIDTIRKTLNSGEELTVSALRGKLGSSRKFVVPILEETDRLKITERQGDIRVRGEKFEKE